MSNNERWKYAARARAKAMTTHFLTACYKGGSQDMRPGYLIQFSYDEFVVEALKKAVPHTEREWRPDSKTWWISEEYESVLNELFSNWYALAKLQGTLF